MNPTEIRRALAPILGDEVARALAAVAADHKTGAEFTVSVKSGMLVVIAEKFAESVGPK